ncbi:MAG: hypothetical protein JWL75_558 [Parcubacteria group bacterium]|nr:hypothetical protein [Parcubacteria group bacterium]
MWPGADPDAIVDAYRHPVSKPNVTGIHEGKEAQLSPEGELQVQPMCAHMKKQGVRRLFCSQADRALIPTIEMATKHSLSMQADERFDEFLRPDWTIGREPDDPEVSEFRRRRIESFSPNCKPLKGEHGLLDSAMITSSGLQLLLDTAIEQEEKHLGLLTHGLHLRRIFAWIMSRGDFDRFGWYFQDSYYVGGLENAAHLRFWYGHPFRNLSRRCWNVELGDNSYLPLELQSFWRREWLAT